MKIKKLVASILALSMVFCCETSVFAAEKQSEKPELQKIDEFDDINSLLSEEVVGEIKVMEDENLIESYALPLGKNDMVMVGIEAEPIAYNPTTEDSGVFANYKQSFTNENASAYVGGYVYQDEMDTIRAFYASYGYRIIGWRTKAYYYFKMDSPVDYYYSTNGSAERRIALSISDNMKQYVCTFDKLVETGEESKFYTTTMSGRYGYKNDSGNTVYNTFRANISFNVSR